MKASASASRSSVVRKTAYGRTMLFLPEKGSIIREVKCMGGTQQHRHANVYHVLPSLMSARPVHCWHCCEDLSSSTRIPLPRFYDLFTKTYYVYGATCSPECAKAYVAEHSTFDRGHQMSTLFKMLREVYGVVDQIVQTPSRPCLVRFGGFLQPKTRKDVVCQVVEPPFVSYCMIAEEKNIFDSNTETSIPVPLTSYSESASLRSSLVAETNTSFSSREEMDAFDKADASPMFERFVKCKVTENDPAKSDPATPSSAPIAPVRVRLSKKDGSVAQKRSASSEYESVGPITKFVRPQRTRRPSSSSSSSPSSSVPVASTGSNSAVGSRRNASPSMNDTDTTNRKCGRFAKSTSLPQ